ncbi:winged helix-turn-helix transcriptional regulator [Crossiella sp. SN42]|uniref:winged helix-turn-helix transcriptional regulator n=1 Tax=Crossiella sp. SN42 TaxID=2944808 RepID=UPI00207D268D|nr:winged helix-turn-helix transcriptional regulator [Crossiella sp. SN42]MCO1580535.1 winged helix-turn-helix transcriptional regulator [Crossiella sp. SN42]
MGDQQSWQDLATRTRILSGDWVVPVLAVLSRGSRRYKELLNQIRAAGPEYGTPSGERTLHERTLSNTLKTLEARGLVSRREVERGIPPVVVYALTDEARRIIETARSAGR